MKVACKNCGARLKVNRNLAGTKISCPECGEALIIPKRPADAPAAAAPPEPKPSAPRSTAPAARPRSTSTGWLVAAQMVLGLAGFALILAAFRPGRWDPPAWSLFRANGLALTGAGLFALLLSALARARPVGATLAGALAAIAVGAWSWRLYAYVDASRSLALVVAMVALWCALEHRRARRGA